MWDHEHTELYDRTKVMSEVLKTTLPIPGKGIPLYQAGPYTIYRRAEGDPLDWREDDTRAYWIEGDVGGNRIPVQICWDEEDALRCVKAWGAEPIPFVQKP